MSTNADGIHIAWTPGDVAIDNCDLARMGDDGMNLHASWLAITDVDAATSTIELELRGAGGYARFEAGDTVELADAALHPQDTAMVMDVASDTHPYRLTLDALPPGIAEEWVLANLSWIPNSVSITRTTVRENRARGLLTQYRNVRVDDCTFEHTTGPAVHVTTDINSWYEGPGADDVIVQNCEIQGVNRGAVQGDAAIRIFAELPTGTPWVGTDAPSPVHRNIVLRNNIIAGTPESAIFVGSGSDITIQGNDFIDVCASSTGEEGRHPVFVRNSSNVEILDNTLSLSPTALGVGQDSSSGVTEAGNDF